MPAAGACVSRSTVFSTVHADWYRSNASELYVAVAQGQDTRAAEAKPAGSQVRAVARGAGWEADPVEIMIEALVVLVLALGLACGQTPPPPAVVEAVNDVDPQAPVGERPYEMVEAGRVEERTPLVDFEDLAGWTVEMYDGAEAKLARSREQQMWGQHVAKVEYRGTQPGSRFIVRPPRPVPVPDQFDCYRSPDGRQDIPYNLLAGSFHQNTTFTVFLFSYIILRSQL